MSGVRWRMGMVAVTGVLCCGVPTAASAARVSVTSAIHAQDKAVKNSPAFKKLEHTTVNTPAQAKKVIPELTAAAKKLDQAATAVSKATATTTKQRAGQKDWVTGVRDLSHGFSQLVTALKDVEHGNQAAGKKEALAAQRSLNKGNTVGSKGDRLLGLPTSD